MKFAYVLPEPGNYHDWEEFDADLRAIKQCGYDAVEIQIADPALLDTVRLRASLTAIGLPLCAFQTGGTYATRGNCLCTANDDVRLRTIALLNSFVDLAEQMKSVVVFGSLQGRVKDEPELIAGRKRVVDALSEVCHYAAPKGVVLALEPVNHLEVAYHNTIAEMHKLAREIDLSSARVMIDTFHMNIEEKDMFAPLPEIRDILAHVHLSETNRDVLGTGHWPTVAFLRELSRLCYTGFCSVGIYNSRLSRRKCIISCMDKLKSL